MGRLRSLLLADANAVMDRAAARYARFYERHRLIMVPLSLAGIAGVTVLWIRGVGLADSLAFFVIWVVVAGVVVLAYMAIRALVRRLL